MATPIEQNQNVGSETPDDLRLRLDLMESENLRLRKQLRNLGLISDNPNFDSGAFQRALAFYVGMMWIPMSFVFVAMILVATRVVVVPQMMIGPLPLVDTGGMFGIPGVGVGIFALGGLALGVVAVGGGAVGIIACGGGSLGIIACGGGAFGLVAFGGGAVGLIAMGGGAFGYYALCANGGGKYVFSLRRQDAQAVAFWTRIFPRFKNSVSGPMPVIPIDGTR